MRHIQTFGKFWYDFIVGDDWRIALGVTIAITVVFAVAHEGADLWWLLPLAVAALLAVSVNRATRPRTEAVSSPAHKE
jgi:apolipoprotein N-acyltransferase